MRVSSTKARLYKELEIKLWLISTSCFLGVPEGSFHSSTCLLECYKLVEHQRPSGPMLAPLQSCAPELCWLTVRWPTHDRLRRALFPSITKQSPESGTNTVGDRASTILEQTKSSNFGSIWLPNTFPLLS